MNLYKFLFAILTLGSTNIFTSKLTIEKVIAKGAPTFEDAAIFFQNKKLLKEFYQNRNKAGNSRWPGDPQHLIQELFEGFAAIHKFAIANDQHSIDLIADNTLSSLFGTAWNEFYN